MIAAVVIAENMRKRRTIICRRQLRDASNAFEIPDKIFESLYRLPKVAVVDLIEDLRPAMPHTIRQTAVPTHLRVLAALNYYASGSYQRRVGQDYLQAMGQSTVSDSLACTSNAINEVLLPRWVRFPSTEAEVRGIKERFFEKCHIPGVVGAVDGTHVAIVPPVCDEEHLFLNRKNFHSKNVQIICDYDLKILALNARHGGRNHDSHIWRVSQPRRHMQQNYVNGNRTSWLLGDSGYPIEPWLMTPCPNAEDGSPQANYNRSHVSGRNCVERCIGVWKGWFRCLRRERTMHYTPQRAGIIINAYAVLHNMALHYNVALPQLHLEDPLNIPLPMYEGVDAVNAQREGIAARNRLVAQHFV